MSFSFEDYVYQVVFEVIFSKTTSKILRTTAPLIPLVYDFALGPRYFLQKSVLELVLCITFSPLLLILNINFIIFPSNF